MTPVMLGRVDSMADSKRAFGPAKIDVVSLSLARKAAALRDQTLGDYLSDVVAEAAKRDLQSEAAKIIQMPQKPKR